MAVFQAWPDYSLDFWTQSPGATGPDEYYQYGASLFPIFLLERFGGNDPVFLKDVWESFKQDGTMNMGPTGGGNCSSGNDPDWFQGLDGLLKTHGSDLKTAFSEFAEWRAVVGPHDDGHHFLRGSNYPEPSMGASLSQLPVSGYLDVREYGSRFIEFLPQGDERPLSIIVTAKPEASWSGAVLLWSDTQPVERLGLVYDDKAIARLTTPALGGVTRVLIVVNQIDDGSHKTDDADYFSNRYFRYQVEQLAAPGLDAGMPPDTAPPGLDAAPGPDAPAGPDATPSPTDAGMAADAGSSTANPGCGCSAPGAGASAMLALLALAGVKRRRLSPRA
jgi:uncharacterized protein (TIGR03382 family)